MPKKLNSSILPDDVIQKMNVSIEFSKSNNIEVGFNLCTENSNKQLHDEAHCSGAECSVDIPKGCNRGQQVGLFHTHPAGNSKPSIQDIANAYQIGANCIGSTEGIKCYLRKDNLPSRKGLETIISALIIYESPLHKSKNREEFIKSFERWTNIRNDLRKQFLNTIDIQ